MCYSLFALFVVQSTVMLHLSALFCVRQLTEIKQFLSYFAPQSSEKGKFSEEIRIKGDPVLTNQDQNNNYKYYDKTSKQKNVQ